MTARPSKFVVKPKRDRLGRKRWRWNLLATNGEIIATSELYNSKEAALNGLDAVRQLALSADLHVES